MHTKQYYDNTVVMWTDECPLWGSLGLKGTWAASGWSFLDASLSGSGDHS